MTNLDAQKRSSAIVLHMDPVVRDARMAVGNEQLLDPDSVPKILQVLRDYFAPGALDSIYQEVVRFSHF